MAKKTKAKSGIEIDLFGLGWKSFEQMVQSLSLKILGPGVVIFGDGPDTSRRGVAAAEIQAWADVWPSVRSWCSCYSPTKQLEDSP